MNVSEIVKKLKELSKNAKAGYKEGMARFGIVSENALGISVPELRKLAKEIKKSNIAEIRHECALSLWKQNIHEAKLLASMIDDPKLVTERQMEEWAYCFYSWDVCDQCCMNLFDKTEFCDKKIREWVKEEKEFVRRAGFALMACAAWHDKKSPDERFLTYLPIIERYSNDDRNFVKKAVNWALRQIGKRNVALRKEALKLAKKLNTVDPKHKTECWIGADAARELEKI